MQVTSYKRLLEMWPSSPHIRAQLDEVRSMLASDAMTGSPVFSSASFGSLTGWPCQPTVQRL